MSLESKQDQFIDIQEASYKSGLRGRALRAHCMRLLDSLEGYDWSGIYRLEGEMLVLDEFVGQDTDHTRIPIGKGVCGTAVADDANQIVGDVTALQNYLFCSLETKSEIVVLIRKEGQILGQIDIDSHRLDTFSEVDEKFLEGLAELMAERWSG